MSRRKGRERENQIVKLHKELGIDAKRIPLSGAAPGFKGDVIIANLRGEVKSRKGGTGFKTLERWIGDNDVLFITHVHEPGRPPQDEDRRPMVVLPWKTWEKLIAQNRS